MPNLIDRSVDEPIKMLIMADPGMGKTCALASLVNAGWNVRVLDFDNKVSAMIPYLTEESLHSDRVKYITLTDKLKVSSDGVVRCEGIPNAIVKCMTALDNWKTKSEDLGKVTSWTKSDILVMDTLTFMGDAAMRKVKVANARDGKRTHPQDWGDAQQIQRNLLQVFFSSAIKCNVIVLSHITFMGGASAETLTDNKEYQKTTDSVEPESPMTAYPTGLGRAMPPEVGRYFKEVLCIKVRGTGASAKRVLLTSSQPYMPLKCSRPDLIKGDVPLVIDKNGHADPNEGLAKYFRLLLGFSPKHDQSEEGQ